VEDFDGRRFDTTIAINEAIPITTTINRGRPSCDEYNLDGSRSNNGSISCFPTGGAGNFTYSWADTSLTSSSRTGLVAGTYTVTITDANGCELSSTAVLEADEAINAIMVTAPIEDDGSFGTWLPLEDTLVCYLSRLILDVDYDLGDNIEWTSNPYPDIFFDYPDLIENSDTASLTARDEGQVVVYVTTDNCMDFELLNITLYDTLNPSISTSGYRIGDTIYAPQGVALSLWVEETAYATYNWIGIGPFSSTNEPTTTLTPEEDQLVTFEGTTPDGCVDRGYVYIKNQIPIDVYGVFTPNDDGYNDYWLIPNAIQYPELEVTVFDRWGQQVFYSKPYGIDMHHVFDGKSQKSGNDLPVGTYYYIIKPNDGEQGTFTGTVTIVR
jgi:gliding motility-associated-like protein